MLERRAEELGYDLDEEREWWKENVPETPWPSYLKNAVQDAENCAVVDDPVPDVLPEPVEEDDDAEDDDGEEVAPWMGQVREHRPLRREKNGSGCLLLVDRMAWVSAVERYLNAGPSACSLLWRMAFRAFNEFDVVWASMDALAKESGMGRRTVIRAIAELQTCGVIRTYRRISPHGGVHHVHQVLYRKADELEDNDPFPVRMLPTIIDEFIREQGMSARQKLANMRGGK